MKKEFCDLCGKETPNTFPIVIGGSKTGKTDTLHALPALLIVENVQVDACASCNAKAWAGIKKVFEDLKPSGGLPL